MAKIFTILSNLLNFSNLLNTFSCRDIYSSSGGGVGLSGQEAYPGFIRPEGEESWVEVVVVDSSNLYD